MSGAHSNPALAAMAEPAPAIDRRLVVATRAVAALCLVGAFVGAVFDRTSTHVTEYFLAVQDTPVLLLLGLFLIALPALAYSHARNVAPSLDGRMLSPRTAWIAATLVCCAACLGTWLIFRNFALTVDELMAEFDAQIFAHGKLLAVVAPEWRDYVPALQPIFLLAVPDHAYWISSYLPMNAALRALFQSLGNQALTGPILAGVAIVVLFRIARLLWPGRPDAAIVAVVLLACSSQFLLTAMTPYAMTAHLAFNLVWLWLFLRDTRSAHAAAGSVAFVACGLHQVIFHPLFAAPFLASLLVTRRWKLAIYYASIYAFSGLFWILYWSLLLRWSGTPAEQSAAFGGAYFIQRIAEMISFDPNGLALMGINLIRFIVWQCPLTIPLALVGLTACRQADRPICNLAAGIVLTVFAMLVLLPFQGHGWGYRYLHGFLGSFALLAAQGWILITGRLAHAGHEARPFGGPAVVLVAGVVFFAAIQLPWQAFQARAFVRPYAVAVDAIKHAKADVVVVDTTNVWYGADLIRNDPLLKTSPKVLGLGYLDEMQLAHLCANHSVAIFDQADARRMGVRSERSTDEKIERNGKLREFMRARGCGRSLAEASQ